MGGVFCFLLPRSNLMATHLITKEMARSMAHCIYSHIWYSSGSTSGQENTQTKSDVKPPESEAKQQFSVCLYLGYLCGEQKNWARTSHGSCLRLKASEVNQANQALYKQLLRTGAVQEHSHAGTSQP